MPKNTVEISLNLKTRIAEQYKRVANRIKGHNAQIKQSMAATGAAADKSFGRARASIQGMGSSIKSFATAFGPAAIAVGVFAVAIRGVGKAMAFTTEKTEGFQKSMSKIRAIVQPTEQGMKQLTEQAKQLGETTAFSASEAADAFTELGKIGFKTNQIIEASADVLNLAAVAETDMATAATVTGETMAGFGIKAEEANRVVDVMAKSFSSSALDMTKFSESAKFVGATAGALNVPLEDTTAALSALANAGVHGSMAGTAMRRIMLLLHDPTSKAGKLIGVTANDTRTFAQRLEALQSKNLSPAQIKSTFGLLATTSATVLIKANKQVSEFTDLYNEADGTAKKMADTMLDNVAGATKILESAQEGLAIAFGETFGAAKQKRIEFYTRLLGWLKDTVIQNKEQFRQFGEQVSEVLMGLAKIGQVIAGTLIRNFDAIISALKVMAAFAGMKGIMALVGGFRALSVAVTGAGGKMKVFKAHLMAIQSVGIMAFVIGLQMAFDKLLGSMEETIAKKDAWADTGTTNIEQMEKLLALRAKFDGARAEANRQEAAAGRDMIQTTWGTLQNTSAINNTHSEALKIMRETKEEMRELTGFTVKEMDASNMTTLSLSNQIAALKRIKQVKETNAAIDADAARKAAEQAMGTLGGGGTGGTDTADKEAEAAAERQAKAIEQAQQLQEALAVQRLEGIDRERMELQQWYTEKGELLMANNESLENLNAVYRQRNEAIEKKFREKQVADEKIQADKIKAINDAKWNSGMNSLRSFAQTLEFVASKQKSFAGLFKAVAISETIISTYLGAQKAFTSMASIPVVGPALGAAAAGAAIASGLVRVAQIKAQKFAAGGIVQGNRDTVPAMLTPGEMVFNSQQQRNLMGIANGTGAGGAATTNNIEINIANGDAETVRAGVNAALADTRQEQIQQFAEMENEVSALDAGVSV